MISFCAMTLYLACNVAAVACAGASSDSSHENGTEKSDVNTEVKANIYTWLFLVPSSAMLGAFGASVWTAQGSFPEFCSTFPLKWLQSFSFISGIYLTQNANAYAISRGLEPNRALGKFSGESAALSRKKNT